MINNFSELVVALKNWWHTPIKFERKLIEEKVMTPEEFKKLPPNLMDIINGYY